MPVRKIYRPPDTNIHIQLNLSESNSERSENLSKQDPSSSLISVKMHFEPR